jgi:excisionase family DNA binding protein
MNEFLTPEEAAERLNVTPRTVYSWLWAKPPKIEGQKVGGKWIIPVQATESLIRPKKVKQRSGAQGGIVVEFHGSKGAENKKVYEWAFIGQEGESKTSHEQTKSGKETQVQLIAILTAADSIICMGSKKTELLDLFEEAFNEKNMETHSTFYLALSEQTAVREAPSDKYSLQPDLGEFTVLQDQTAMLLMTHLYAMIAKPRIIAATDIVNIDLRAVRAEAEFQMRRIMNMDTEKRDALMSSFKKFGGKKK